MLSPNFCLADCGSIISQGSQISSFVKNHVTIVDCANWDLDSISQALNRGIESVCQLNPKMTQEILETRLERDLKLTCTVPPDEVQHYQDHTIYLHPASNGKLAKYQGTFFHEFLHFSGVAYDGPHDGSDESIPTDAIYSFHLSAFP